MKHLETTEQLDIKMTWNHTSEWTETTGVIQMDQKEQQWHNLNTHLPQQRQFNTWDNTKEHH